MGQVILVTSGKGGSGKSTFTVNCGSVLAEEGKKVLLIDTDAGLRALDLMLNVSDRVVYDLNDVLGGQCEPVKAIVQTDTENLQLLPAPQSVACEFLDADEFKRLCRGLSHYYDYIFIDSPAGIGAGASMVAAACDRAIVVATADPVCIRDADRIATVLNAIEVSDIRLVINRVNPRLIRKKMVPDLDAAIDGAALQLIGVIPEDENVTVASYTGKIVADMGKKVSQAYRNIAARIDGREVPLMKL